MNRRILIFIFVLFGSAHFSFAAEQVRQRQLFVWDWKFLKGDADGAEKIDFNDSAWRTLNLPHDWSIEGPYDQSNPSGGPGGFMPTGIGWYRKSFPLPTDQRGKHFVIEFGGVYMNSDVWINGQHLGKWPFGYSSFNYDLTPHLRFGNEPNVLAVRIDDSRQPSSRWYSGAGIYRNVWLTATDPLRVGQWGTYVTIPKASTTSATVRVRTTIQNDRASQQDVSLTTRLVDSDDKVVASSDQQKQLAAGTSSEVDQTIELANPRLWSLQAPAMYTVHSIVKVGGQVVDDYDTPIGVREIAYDLNKGFLLNGERVKMNGVCVHSEAGAVGMAVPDAVWVRRLNNLKDMGCNAIRTSHNPPSQEFLDLCDRMGFLIMDEAFDEWTIQKPQIQYGYSKFFNDWYEKDLVNFTHRDRNHPSVVMWSAGNEIGEQRAATGPAVLGKLVTVFHREDPTRPVTAGMDNVYTDRGEAPAAFTDLLDIVGYNYVDRWGERRETFYTDDRLNHPNRRFVGTESSSMGGVRDSYQLPVPGSATPAPATQPDAARGARRGGRGGGGFGRGSYLSSIVRPEQLWKFVRLHDYVIGDFMWTGIDYLGETGAGRRGAGSGQIDTAGFPKDGYYFYQSQWTDKPMIHLFPHWNWPGHEGQVLPVVAYTNCDTVDLLVNGTSFGSKSIEFPRQGNAGSWNSYARPYVAVTTADLHLSWDVPYEPGALRAVGRRNGQIVCATEIHTTGPASAIVLSADRPSIRADARDVAHLTVRIVDDKGLVVPGANAMISYDLEGPAALLGIDSGDLSDLTNYNEKQRKAFNGLSLVMVQSTRQSGRIRLTARADGLKQATIEIESQPASAGGRP